MKRHLRPTELKLFAMLLILAIRICGCSSSYTLSSRGKPNAEYSYGEMNEELTGRDVIIELKDGREMSSEVVTISDDSVSWLHANIAEKSKMATRQVKKIVIKNHLVGALEGVGIVGPAVFVGSWSLGGFSSEGIGGSEGWALPAALGLIGGGVGLITGAIMGHSYEYEFSATVQSDSLQNGK